VGNVKRVSDSSRSAGTKSSRVKEWQRIEGALRDDPNATESNDAEHFKWAADLNILESFDFGQPGVLSNFIRLIKADPDRHLHKGAVKILVQSGRATPSDFEELP
jgi:hypothetical protein